jgi:hypothetical protein
MQSKSKAAAKNNENNNAQPIMAKAAAFSMAWLALAWRHQA